MNHFFIAEVPSNIAFVKYWGKLDKVLQWPANDSISMTLSHAKTITSARVLQHHSESAQDIISKDGVLLARGTPGADKAYRHLDFLREQLGFSAALEIHTKNTFPSECGIASSASGLGALTLSAVAAWTNSSSLDELQLKGHTLSQLSALARIGSGSACRSFFGGFVEWKAGASALQQEVLQVANQKHWDLSDLILIVSKEKKPVSSTEAHESAWSSPLFKPRLAGIKERLLAVKHAIKSRDLSALGHAIEADAIEMHAVMMTSTPPARYMTSDSEGVISWIRTERGTGSFDAWFTMDAGPNVHIICRAENAETYAKKIKDKFPEFELIVDSTGGGPVLLRGTPN
jgi:diphosphomevalonate decarboxylase